MSYVHSLAIQRHFPQLVPDIPEPINRMSETLKSGFPLPELALRRDITFLSHHLYSLRVAL